MKKKTLLGSLIAGLMMSAGAAHADTTLGFTIYKYDDNFMSVVRRAIEKQADTNEDVRLLMNDSQNSQSMQNDQIDIMLARGVDALAINWLTLLLHQRLSARPSMKTSQLCSSTRNQPKKHWQAMTRLTT